MVCLTGLLKKYINNTNIKNMREREKKIEGKGIEKAKNMKKGKKERKGGHCMSINIVKPRGEEKGAEGRERE